MKKILIVSKYFYPLENTRSLQAQLFANQLSEDYQVDVVTAEDDFSDFNKVNITLYGVSSFTQKQPIKRSRILSKLFKRVENELGFYWARKAGKLIESLILTKNYSLIISLSETFDSHLSVYGLKSKRECPWVAFFSDPWPSCILPEPYYSKKFWLIPPLQKFFARKVLDEVDRVLLTSKRSAKVFLDGLDIDVSGKTIVIPHLTPNIDCNRNSCERNKNIIHAGTLNAMRGCPDLIMMFNEWLELNPEFGDLVLYGNIFDSNGAFDNLPKIKKAGFVSQSECFDIYCSSRALLIIEAEMNFSPFIPSKFAEYCQTNLPVIAIVNRDSLLAELVESFGNGITIFHGDSKNEVFDKLDSLRRIIVDFESRSRIEKYYDNKKINKFVRDFIDG